MIDVGVGKKDFGNPREFGRRQIANARAAIDYHVVIDEKRRGAKLTADPAVATQTWKSHAASPCARAAEVTTRRSGGRHYGIWRFSR